MTLQRMDNVLIVIDDLEAAKAFFVELGMELEGETLVEGTSVDRLVGLQNVRATIALMRTPDGHGQKPVDRKRVLERMRAHALSADTRLPAVDAHPRRDCKAQKLLTQRVYKQQVLGRALPATAQVVPQPYGDGFP
jgi:hypothetical protein